MLCVSLPGLHRVAVRKCIRSLFIRTGSCLKSPSEAPGPASGPSRRPQTWHKRFAPRARWGQHGCFGARRDQGATSVAAGFGPEPGSPAGGLECEGPAGGPCLAAPWRHPSVASHPAKGNRRGWKKGVWFQKDSLAVVEEGKTQEVKLGAAHSLKLSSAYENWPLFSVRDSPGPQH